ncbi:MAG: rhodanese-like domain-containing protein [Deltaproteobacteria bacterium]|nr:rhodanese-like domain-containing protein [Deltaproteobacteria bacterium]
MTKKEHSKRLFLEMAVIVLIAAVVGIIWNHRLLLDVYTGKPAEAKSAPAVSREPVHTLVPAGLEQVKDLFARNEAVFVDAREASVFSNGHVKGAFSFPVGEFDAKLAEFRGKVAKDAILVIYCNGFGCHDSKLLGEKLVERGYNQILLFEGGFPEWKDAGLPTEGPGQ